jgi:serine protease Do/serine protease DegQ
VELRDEMFEGRLVGAEPSINLAVLKVEDREKFQPVKIAASNSVAVGHWAIAIGDPPGPGTAFATGSVSAVPSRQCYQEQRSATLLTSSARVPSGAVGGPLLNIHGEVIGISLPRLLGSGPNFALPMQLAMTLYEPLLVRESKRSPWIGVSVRQRGSGARVEGVLIDDVFDPSPASRAGIRAGDVLLSAGQDKMQTVSDFQRWLYLNGIGATVTIRIWHEFEISERTITIEERPASATMR